jgi:hypothetical protein
MYFDFNKGLKLSSGSVDVPVEVSQLKVERMGLFEIKRVAFDSLQQVMQMKDVILELFAKVK